MAGYEGVDAHELVQAGVGLGQVVAPVEHFFELGGQAPAVALDGGGVRGDERLADAAARVEDGVVVTDGVPVGVDAHDGGHLAAAGDGDDLGGGLAKLAGHLAGEVEGGGEHVGGVLLDQAGRGIAEAVFDVGAAEAAQALIEGGGLDAGGAEVNREDDFGFGHLGSVGNGMSSRGWIFCEDVGSHRISRR